MNQCIANNMQQLTIVGNNNLTYMYLYIYIDVYTY